MEDVVIKLDYPITKGEVTIDELKFTGRPKARHMLAGDGHEKGSWAYEIAIMSALTGVPEILLKELDHEDFIRADVAMGQRFNAFYDYESSKTNDPQIASQE